MKEMYERPNCGNGTEKIKVLQVNKLYYPWTGGVERVVQQLAEGLCDETDMKVLVCQVKGRTTVETVNNVPVYKADSLGIYFSMPISISFIRHLRKLSKDRDVLHFHMPFPLGDLACLLSGFKGKVVVWWHSDIVRQKRLMMLYRPIMEKFLERADVIIVATQGHIDGSDYLPKYRSKCVIIPYGLSKEFEKKADNYCEKIHPRIKQAVKMLFVGRLVYYKGCDVLIEAFRKVNGAELVIIGDGVLKTPLLQKVISYGLENKVTFLGSVDKDRLNQALEECDVFILPSVAKSEAFGLVQIEAMAYGKPVINTNLSSGVPHVSLDHVTGLTVPPNDVEALANAMQWMVDHEEERLQMGKRARERVKKNYRLDVMLNRILDLYNQLVSKERNKSENSI